MLLWEYHKTIFFRFSWCSFSVHEKVRSSHQRCSIEIGVFKNFTKFTGKHLCQGLFLNKVAGACNFIKSEALTQVFSCEFYQILRTLFLQNTSGQLLLKNASSKVKVNLVTWFFMRLSTGQILAGSGRPNSANFTLILVFSLSLPLAYKGCCLSSA